MQNSMLEITGYSAAPAARGVSLLGRKWLHCRLMAQNGHAACLDPRTQAVQLLAARQSWLAAKAQHLHPRLLGAWWRLMIAALRA